MEPLEEKYPNVFKSLELWSTGYKEIYQYRFNKGILSSVEYLDIMNHICVSTMEEVDKWLNGD